MAHVDGTVTFSCVSGSSPLPRHVRFACDLSVSVLCVGLPSFFPLHAPVGKSMSREWQ
jgi:hypothetical protein